MPLIVYFPMSCRKSLFLFLFLSVVLYDLVTSSKATFLCLTVKGKEIKGEEGFFKPNFYKSGKWWSEMGGEICPRMDFNPKTIKHEKVSRDHLDES